MSFLTSLGNLKDDWLRIVRCEFWEEFWVVDKGRRVGKDSIGVLSGYHMDDSLLSLSVGVSCEGNLSFYFSMDGMILSVISILSRGPLESSLSNDNVTREHFLPSKSLDSKSSSDRILGLFSCSCL